MRIKRAEQLERIIHDIPRIPAVFLTGINFKGHTRQRYEKCLKFCRMMKKEEILKVERRNEDLYVTYYVLSQHRPAWTIKMEWPDVVRTFLPRRNVSPASFRIARLDEHNSGCMGYVHLRGNVFGV